MKILLVQPPSGSSFSDKVFLHEPLALEYLGAGLRMDGHDVRLHDARLDPDVESVLAEFEPRIVGLTGYTIQVPVICSLADRIKSLRPGTTIVVGGHHATVRPGDFNRDSVAVIVIGEGVTTMREIARCLDSGDNLKDIQGLALPGTEMRFTDPRPYPPLDELPFPDRSLTAPYRSHYFSEWLKPIASIRTSLGCTARCNFCALWEITGGRYLRRKTELVVEELKTIEEKNVFFCDDESMCDARRMDHLADLIREAGIEKRYFLYSRGDTIVKHPDVFAKWRDIGLHLVFVGMETFSPERLSRMDKGLSIEDQEKAAGILEDLGVIMYASFMVDPDFTHADFAALRDYVRRLKLRHASYSILTPLPGTRMYEERADQMLPYQPELFDFLHTALPTTLPLSEFYAEFAGLYEKAIPRHRAFRTLALYGMKRIPEVLKLIPEAINKLKSHHLDHRNEAWTP